MDQNPSHSELHSTPRFPQLITEMILELITEMPLTQSVGHEQMHKMNKRMWRYLILSEHQQQLLNVDKLRLKCVYSCSLSTVFIDSLYDALIYSIANRLILLYNERKNQEWNMNISTDFQQ